MLETIMEAESNTLLDQLRIKHENHATVGLNGIGSETSEGVRMRLRALLVALLGISMSACAFASQPVELELDDDEVAQKLNNVSFARRITKPTIRLVMGYGKFSAFVTAVTSLLLLVAVMSKVCYTEPLLSHFCKLDGKNLIHFWLPGARCRKFQVSIVDKQPSGLIESHTQNTEFCGLINANHVTYNGQWVNQCVLDKTKNLRDADYVCMRSGPRISNPGFERWTNVQQAWWRRGARWLAAPALLVAALEAASDAGDAMIAAVLRGSAEPAHVILQTAAAAILVTVEILVWYFIAKFFEYNPPLCPEEREKKNLIDTMPQ